MSNDHVIELYVAGTFLLVLFAFFLILFLITQKQKQNKFLIEKQKMIYTYQNEILRTRIEMQENAMEHISKEIHDNIGQILGLIQMNVKSISNSSTDEKLSRLVGNINNLLDQAISDTRNISHSLNSETIKKIGLIALLKNELDYISISGKIECTFEVVGEKKDFPPEKELLIYRIAQEAIHNTLKHANASRLRIELDYSMGGFVMTISDNGVGFDEKRTMSSNGIGLVNMYQRAELLNGNINIRSAPAAGSTVTLTIDEENGG